MQHFCGHFWITFWITFEVTFGPLLRSSFSCGCALLRCILPHIRSVVCKELLTPFQLELYFGLQCTEARPRTPSLAELPLHFFSGFQNHTMIFPKTWQNHSMIFFGILRFVLRMRAANGAPYPPPIPYQGFEPPQLQPATTHTAPGTVHGGSRATMAIHSKKNYRSDFRYQVPDSPGPAYLGT